jgi:sulfonate transport system substrate-binding protein
MMQPLIKLSLATLAALAALGSACSKGEGDSARADRPAPGAPPQGTITVQLGYQKIGAPFLLKARSQDLDRQLSQLNAKAEWKEFKHGPGLLEAINASEVDIGYVGETPPVFAQAGGTDFVYVASDPPAPKAEAIVVRKDSPLEKLADLKGKKVALNRGSNVHYLLLKALEKASLSIRDVEAVYLAPGDARPAFETGKFDAWLIWDPFLAAAEAAGARVLVNGEGLVDNHLFYVARRKFAEQHPELIKVVLDEYRALSDWESKHAEEASRILEKSSGISYDALLVTERRHTYGIIPITPELLEKQQAIADAFRKLELIPKEIRLTNAFSERAAYRVAP